MDGQPAASVTILIRSNHRTILTGEEGTFVLHNLAAGERLVEMNYDIHVGAIGGLTGKIIAFIASLICARLPVTGFLIWWWKKRRAVQ